MDFADPALPWALRDTSRVLGLRVSLAQSPALGTPRLVVSMDPPLCRLVATSRGIKGCLGLPEEPVVPLATLRLRSDCKVDFYHI